MKNWYKSITRGQKIFLYVLSSVLVLVYAVGLVPLLLLIYLELGNSSNSKVTE
ncbi:hypothetical protein AWB73_05289 [Caballeronia turbans]|nr:hypothetical protein AWB73_05289 [Caballeronia turbans]